MRSAGSATVHLTVTSMARFCMNVSSAFTVRLVAKRPHVACGIPQVFLYITRRKRSWRSCILSARFSSPFLPLPFPFPSFLPSFLPSFFSFHTLCFVLGSARRAAGFCLGFDSTRRRDSGFFGNISRMFTLGIKGMLAFSLVALHRFTI